jgi:hypothetical protein
METKGQQEAARRKEALFRNDVHQSNRIIEQRDDKTLEGSSK